MRAVPSIVAGLSAALVLTACGAAPAPEATSPAATATATAPDPSPSSTLPAAERLDGTPFNVQELGTFDEPWAMAFLPGSEEAVITERGGQLILRTADGNRIEVAGVPEVVHAGQGGLGDVIVSPTYAQDQTIYLSWAASGDGGSGAEVARAQLVREGDGARLGDLQVIWRQEPKTTGNGHYGHRMAFSPDGRYLFITSGDRQKMQPAQDLGNTLGTIVRLNPDGTAADGNPFADRGGVSAQIWTYGNRNPLGIAFDPDGRLWSSEMGPQGGDELNLIERGANYGWPEASNGSHYGGADIPDHRSGDGFTAPKVSWNPSISPGSLMIYSGAMFPDWDGDAFIGALSGQALIRVHLDGTNAEKADQWDFGARVRAVNQAPDGSIWVLEDGSNGRLLRLTPA